MAASTGTPESTGIVASVGGISILNIVESVGESIVGSVIIIGITVIGAGRTYGAIEPGTKI
jgi:hypothetical protein